MKKNQKIFYLEISCDGDSIKVGGSERIKDEEETISHYEKNSVSMELINSRCLELVNTLNKANRMGNVNKNIVQRIGEIGRLFHDELLPLNVKERLNNTKAKHLCLKLDDQLTHIPWELLHNGKQFLCRRFYMGRLIKTRQTLFNNESRIIKPPLQMLILADPGNNLEGAYAEGIHLRDFIDQKGGLVEASLRSDNISINSVKEKIREYDIVHFAGHAEYNPDHHGKNGWQLSDGIFSTEEIKKMAGTHAMPMFVFANACQSARYDEKQGGDNFHNEIFSTANAFLLSGVKHYLGTFWEIQDEPGSRFAIDMYKYLFSGLTIGEAVKRARDASEEAFGDKTILWASYVLYGDPTVTYSSQDVKRKENKGIKQVSISSPPRIRTHKETTDFAINKNSGIRLPLWAAASLAGIVVLIGLSFIYYKTSIIAPVKYKQQTLDLYRAGNHEAALKSYEALNQKNQASALGLVLLGNIQFLQGNINKAGNYFKAALNAEHGDPSFKADALMGLGRIASIENRKKDALVFYKRTVSMAPEKIQAYIAQAALMDQNKQFKQALTLITKARSLSPDDKGINSFFNYISKRVSIETNKEKQDKIDRLINELLTRRNNSETACQTDDDWTSLPLTVWIMDFKSNGYSLYEGENSIIKSCINDMLLQNTRVRIVERAILDSLLEELKIGTSDLADNKISLSIGKIMAARVIMSGQIIHAGPRTQIAFRFIDTQTSRITASANKIFIKPMQPDEIAKKIAPILENKIKTIYPLRGKIKSIREKKIILNIGKEHGVHVGNCFQVIDTNLIIEVIAVQMGQSAARVKEGAADIVPGLYFQDIRALQKGLI